MHLKLLAGLIGDGPASKLTEWEELLIGALPKAEPDSRVISLDEFYLDETNYEARLRGITWVVELDGQRWELSV